MEGVTKKKTKTMTSERASESRRNGIRMSGNRKPEGEQLEAGEIIGRSKMLTSGPELRASIHPGLRAEFGNGESFVNCG